MMATTARVQGGTLNMNDPLHRAPEPMPRERRATRRDSRRYKRPRRRRSSPLRWLLLPVLVLALAVVGVYYVSRFPKTVQQISYPLHYRDEIIAHCAPYGLDPARVAAVIYCESSFDPNAVSSVGARGLMQIMPETAEWLSTKFDDIDYLDPAQLFDPALNLKFGCWYLDYLDNRFDGDLTKATAAYHTGQGHVDEWLKDPNNSSDGVTLDVIPSSATNTYVGRVLQAYEQYKELFLDEPEAKS